MGSGASLVKISAFFTNYAVTFVIIASIVVPVTANASWCLWFCTPEAEAEEHLPNSQNMPLLQAAISPNQGTTSTKSDLAIVGGTSLSPETVSTSDIKTAEDDQISIYVVHSGDTLPAIAKMFGVSVNTIRWGNDIKGNTITPGQTLVILPISGVQHVVKSGDTIQSIAKLHKGDFDEILQYNNLTKSSKLAIGDIITVPDGEVLAISSGSKSVTSGSKSTPTYVGYYMRPIVGGRKSQGIHGHNGVDMASSYGSNILASASGEVIVSRGSGYNGGYGLYIVIKHGNGTQTLYAHMSSVLVSAGDRVSQGQVIGKMGSTGKSSGTHLHFEIRGARNPF